MKDFIMKYGGCIVVVLLVVVGELLVQVGTPCKSEDTTQMFCTWDASDQGNGKGEDFTRIFGITFK